MFAIAPFTESGLFSNAMAPSFSTILASDGVELGEGAGLEAVDGELGLVLRREARVRLAAVLVLLAAALPDRRASLTDRHVDVLADHGSRLHDAVRELLAITRIVASRGAGRAVIRIGALLVVDVALSDLLVLRIVIGADGVIVRVVALELRLAVRRAARRCSGRSR